MSRNQVFRHLIHDVSQELSTDNSSAISFISGVSSSQFGQQQRGCCCHKSCINTPLDLLTCMLNKGCYSENNIDPLISILKHVNREDLASKCQQYQLQQKEQMSEHRSSSTPSPAGSPTVTKATSPNTLATPPTSSTSTTTPPNDVMQVPLSQRDNLKESKQKICQIGKQIRSRVSIAFQRTRKSTSVSDDDNFILVDSPPENISSPEISPLRHPQLNRQLSRSMDEGMESLSPSPPPLPPSPSRQQQQIQHASLCVEPNKSLSFDASPQSPHITRFSRSLPLNYTQSLPNFPNLISPLSSNKHEPTFIWRVQRKDFIQPLFYHKNKYFEKHLTVTAACSRQEKLRGLTFVMKLYPNGINWDQDSSATLQVRIEGIKKQSHSSSSLSFEVVALEREGGSCQVAARKKVCKLAEEQGFSLKEFLFHDVVKSSQAKWIDLHFTMCLFYELGGKDWVHIGRDEIV